MSAPASCVCPKSHSRRRRKVGLRRLLVVKAAATEEIGAIAVRAAVDVTAVVIAVVGIATTVAVIVVGESAQIAVTVIVIADLAIVTKGGNSIASLDARGF